MRLAIFLLFALVLAGLEVNAIAVASDYLVNGTMELIEGASKIYHISLQNPTSQQESLKIDYDKRFMDVIDYKEIYTLPPNTAGYSVLFNVTAGKPGEYKLGYTVSEVEPAGGGGLPIRLKINRNFKLRVVENPNKFHINYFASIYALALAFIGVVLLKKALGAVSKRKLNK